MYYLATVHFRSAKWIDVQLAYLARHLREPYRTFAVLEGIDQREAEKFDVVVPARGPHAGKLNLLAAEICAAAHPDDVIMFLDGDAFFVADPTPTVLEALEESALVAVRRDENRGDRQPHPCFAAITVGEWERLHGDWTEGYTWRGSTGKVCTDVGGNLLGALERTGTPWTPLLRTNVRNDHPVWFAVYGGIVYHHGAGFRRPWVKADGDPGSGGRRPWGLRAEGPNFGEDVPVLGGLARAVNYRRQKRWVEGVYRRAEELGERWFERLRRDPDFYLDLVGRARQPVERAGGG